MKGIARVCDQVTPAMVNQVLDALEERWAIGPGSGTIAGSSPADS